MLKAFVIARGLLDNLSFILIVEILLLILLLLVILLTIFKVVFDLFLEINISLL